MGAGRAATVELRGALEGAYGGDGEGSEEGELAWVVTVALRGALRGAGERVLA